MKYLDEMQAIDTSQISQFNHQKINEQPRHHQRKQFSMNLFTNIQSIKEKDSIISPKLKQGFLSPNEINSH